MDRHHTDGQALVISESFSESIGTLKGGSILSLVECDLRTHKLNIACVISYLRKEYPTKIGYANKRWAYKTKIKVGEEV